MTTAKILVIGANGQIGTELAEALVARHGRDAVVTSDLAPQGRVPGLAHEALDVTDAGALTQIAERHGITQVYHLAAERPMMWYSPGVTSSLKLASASIGLNSENGLPAISGIACSIVRSERAA